MTYNPLYKKIKASIRSNDSSISSKDSSSGKSSAARRQAPLESGPTGYNANYIIACWTILPESAGKTADPVNSEFASEFLKCLMAVL